MVSCAAREDFTASMTREALLFGPSALLLCLLLLELEPLALRAARR